MKDIVQVFHYSGGQPTNRVRYTFNVPQGTKLKKDDIVLVEQRGGKSIAVCVADSEVVSDVVADMIMQGKQITGNVIVKYTVEFL